MSTIFCALCKKPIDKITVTKQHHTDSILVSVSCHGQWDHAIFTNLFALEYGHLLGNTVGYAFVGTELVPSWHRQDS